MHYNHQLAIFLVNHHGNGDFLPIIKETQTKHKLPNYGPMTNKPVVLRHYIMMKHIVRGDNKPADQVIE